MQPELDWMSWLNMESRSSTSTSWKWSIFLLRAALWMLLTVLTWRSWSSRSDTVGSPIGASS